MYMSMGDIGDIHVFSSSKEFGIILIPEVEFTSFVIHFVFSFRVSISTNFQKQIILSSSTPFLERYEGLGCTTNCSNFLKL